MIGAFIAWGTRKNSPGYIVAENGCHLWIGSVDKDGYGHAWSEGRLRSVHRWRYEREVGPVPDGLELDHFICNNRRCCNPHHVRPVTHRENTLRGNTISGMLAGRSHCARGHELIGENVRRSASGHRFCRLCANETNAASKRRRWPLRTPEQRERRNARARERGRVP